MFRYVNYAATLHPAANWKDLDSAWCVTVSKSSSTGRPSKRFVSRVTVSRSGSRHQLRGEGSRLSKLRVESQMTFRSSHARFTFQLVHISSGGRCFLKLRICAPLCACFSAAVGGWWTSVSPWTWLLTVACYFSLLVIEIAGCWSCTTSRGDPVNDVLPGTVPSSVYHRSRSR